MDIRSINQGDSNDKTSLRPRFNRVSASKFLQEKPDGSYVPIGEDPGPPGQAATVTVGTTTTVNYPVPCNVTNSGTSSDAVLDFTLSRGPAATVAVGTTSTLVPGSSCFVNNVGSSSAAILNFGIAQGQTGTPGAAASVMVGSTTTLPPGTPCSVSNSGTTDAAILNFGIAQGVSGTPGTPGAAATVSIGTVNVVEPPGPPTVVNSGTASAAVLDFGLVRGSDGVSATIAIGNVTALPPGSEPTVVNDGTETNAILAWGLVTGDTGETGASGADGAAASVAVGSVVALAPGSTPTVVNSGTSASAVLDFGLVSGADGQDATITVGTVTALAPGSTPTVVDSGTPGSAVFDFGLVTGDTGATGAGGPPGPDGLAASIAIGTVSAVAYGSAPNVVNVGTPTAAVLDWTLVTGPQGPPGASSSVLEYQFQTATTAPPGTGHIRLDNTPALTNTIYVSHIDGNGVDQDYILQLVQTGSNLIIQKKNNSAILYTYEILFHVVNTGYVRYEVNFVSAAGTLANNDQVILLLVAVGQPGTAATVNVGTVTQVPYGPTAITVTNSGTTSAALLDFVLCPGPDGAPGANGAAATVAVGTTSTLAPGAPASVVNSGTSSAAVLDFGIPAGSTGPTGSAATLTIGSTTTLPAGSSATASNSGTSSAAILNLGIPIGDPGSAATIAVGSVTGLSPGSTPTVTNVGSSSAAVLNFGLTEGAQGTAGLAATVAVGTVSTLAAGQPATVTNSGTPSAAVLNYGIPQGQTGPQGSAATVAVGTVSTLAPGSPATVTNSGTSSAAVLNYGIPQGQTGTGATVAVGTVSTLAAGSPATVTNSGTPSASILNYGIPQGVTGSPGSAATVTVGTVSTLAPGSTATVTNSGTSSAAVLNFGLVTGATGSGSNISIANTATSVSARLLFTSTASGSTASVLNTLASGLTIVPSTGIVTSTAGIVAPSFTGALIGNATSATSVTSSNTTTSVTRFVTFCSSNTGSVTTDLQTGGPVSGTQLTYQPSTGLLTSASMAAATFTGDLVGNASSSTKLFASTTGTSITKFLALTSNNSVSTASDFVTSGTLSYVPSTGTLSTTVVTATTFNGSFVGNASSSSSTFTQRDAANSTRYVNFGTIDSLAGANDSLRTATLFTFLPISGILSVPSVVSTTFTGALVGNASSSTALFTTRDIANSTRYITFGSLDSAGGANDTLRTATALTFVPQSGLLSVPAVTSTTFTGALVGNASSSTQVTTQRDAANLTRYLIMSGTDTASATAASLLTATALNYNPLSSTLTCVNAVVSGTLTASASSAVSLAGGLAGSIPLQSGPGVTTMLGIGTAGFILRSTGTTAAWSTPGGMSCSFGGQVIAAGNILACGVPVALTSSVVLNSVLGTAQNTYVMPYSGILVSASCYSATSSPAATATIHVAGSATPSVTIAAGSFTPTGTRQLTLSSTTTTAAIGQTVEVRINSGVTGITVINLFFA